MSSKNTDHGGLDEFDLPDFGAEPSAHGRTGSAHPHASPAPDDHDFGGDDFFENAPEAPSVRRAAATHHADDGFDDIPGEHEHEHEHGEHVLDHEGGYAHEADAATIDADGHVVAPKSRSKLLIPLGGIAALGLLGFGAWETGLIGGGSHHYAPTPFPARAPVLPGPRLPPPRVVQPGADVAVPPPAVLPPVAATTPSTAVLPGTSIPVSRDVSSTDGPATGMHAPSGDVPTRPVQPVAGVDVQPSIKALFDNTVQLQKTVETGFHAVDDEMAKSDTAVSERFDKASGKLDDLGGHVNNIETRIDAVERRLSAIETGGVSAKSSPAVAAPHGRGHGRHHAVQPPHAAGGLHGYALRGVSSGSAAPSAWVKTPTGSVLVKIGDSMEGAGTVQEIKRAGTSWELVTSDGVIRP